MKIRYIRYYLLLLAALTVPATISAQYYNSGVEPFGTKWNVIDGDHYSVIYPRETDSLARRYLHLFETTREIAQDGMRTQIHKIPIILHPYAMTGRTNVTWAPKKLEIITTPQAYGGRPLNYELESTLMTNRLLAYNEHYDTYIFHFLQHYLFGQQSIAFGVGFYPSVWQAVGEAALFETDFTKSGRGRSGEFLMYYRAAFATGDRREYDNWKYGSYKYFTPDKYAMGYMHAGNFRFFSGNYYAIGDAMHIQMRDWWDIFGVWNRSFQEAAYKTPRKSWRQAVVWYSQLWATEYAHRAPYTPVQNILPKEERIYTEFKDVVPVSGNIIATKSGFQYPRQLVSIDSAGRQYYLRPFAASTSRVVSDGGGNLLWSEVVPDPRWDLRSWSVIRSCNSKTGVVKNITRRTRYFNPSVSEDGKSIFAVEYPVKGGSDIVVVDRECGNALRSIAAPRGGQITEVVQMGDSLYALVTDDDGMSLQSVRYDGVDGDDVDNDWHIVVPGQWSYMQQISASEGKLIFVCDLDGVCNTYSFNPASGELRKIVNSRFGSFNPSIKEGTLYYADFDNLGYHPVKVDCDSLFDVPASFDEKYEPEVAQYLSWQAKQNVTPMSEQESDAIRARIDTLPSKRYREVAHIWHIHSWAPIYANLNNIMNLDISKLSFDTYYEVASLGATLLMQNNLGTSEAQLGYSYHNKFHSGHFNFKYSGLYPVLQLTVDFNDRHSMRTVLSKGTMPVKIEDGIPVWMSIDTLASPSLDIALDAYIPFNLSRSGWKVGIVPEVKLDMRNDHYDIFANGVMKHYGMLYDLTCGVRYYRMLEKSKRQLSPRLGYGIQASYKTSVGMFNESGDMAYLYAYGYLPGFTPDQNIRISASWQKQFSPDGTFSYMPNLCSMPRGYSNRIVYDYSRFTFDYGIFVYMGDLTWPWLFYLKRMQIVPFCDFAVDRSPFNPTVAALHPVKNAYMYSYGTDVLIGTHLLRMGFELNVGVRYARTGEGKNVFQVLFATNLK